MGNTCSHKISPENYEFYWRQIYLSNLLVDSIQLRLVDKRKQNKLDEYILLSDFCSDLHKTIDECAYNKKLLCGVKLKTWRITLLNDLSYSYKLQFDKLNCEFLNENEDKFMNKILLCE